MNLAGGVPLTSVRSPTPGMELDTTDETREHSDGERLPSPSVKSAGPEMPAEETIMTEPEAVPLVVPAALFKSNSYHPMHIFVSAELGEK